MRRSTKTVIVYEVLCDTGRDGGPAGDGTVVRRFRDEDDARRFAASATCYGSPARYSRTDAPRHIAQRWGMA